METVKFYNLGSIKTHRGNKELDSNSMRIYIQKKEGKFATHSIMLSGKAEFALRNFLFMDLAENTLTGEKFIIFSKTNGAEMTRLYKNKTCETFGTQRNFLVREVSNILGIDYSNGVSCDVNLSVNLSKQNDSITYKVLDIKYR